MRTSGRSVIIRCPLWSWQDAIKAVFLDRVNIVEHYDPRGAAAPRFEIQLPSVVSLEILRQADHASPPSPGSTCFSLRDRFGLPVLLGPRRPHLRSHHPAASKGRPDHVGERGSRPARRAICARENLTAAGRPRMFSAATAVRTDRTPAPSATAGYSPPNYLHDSWLDYL